MVLATFTLLSFPVYIDGLVIIELFFFLSSAMVKNAFTKVSSNNFGDFLNLHSTAKVNPNTFCF